MPPPPGPPMPGPPAAAQPYNPVELPGMLAPAPAVDPVPGNAPLPPPPGSQQSQVQQQQQVPDSGGEYGAAAPGSGPPQQFDEAGAPGGQVPTRVVNSMFANNSPAGSQAGQVTAGVLVVIICQC